MVATRLLRCLRQDDCGTFINGISPLSALLAASTNNSELKLHDPRYRFPLSLTPLLP